ncbi:hypothetical protein EV191_116101, partial [Tamaricihabitans halophyticus]
MTPLVSTSRSELGRDVLLDEVLSAAVLGWV